LRIEAALRELFLFRLKWGNIYYRIQGPTLLIEFQVEGNLGANEGHLHSIYRDPTNEYGAAQVGK